MKLDYIRLQNFRQYYDIQTIHFSKSSERNVTIIHGENGCGKTALLSGLRWCLYGRVDLPDPDVLMNERTEQEASEGAELQVSIELKFRDENRDYTVLRKIEGVKKEGKFHPLSNRFTATYINESGRTIEPKNPQSMISQILPKEMAPYFFFDGERIDHMAKREGSKEIQTAIKNIMGLEILERGISHLKDVGKNFSKELEGVAGAEMQTLMQEKQKFEETLISLRERKRKINENISGLKSDKIDIEDALLKAEETRDLQKEKTAHETSKLELQESIGAKELEIKDLCSSRGFLAFVLPLIKKVSSSIDNRRVKGEIPAGIKRQFVQDLLEAGKCICDRCLEIGSEPYRVVEKWLDKSGDKQLEDAFTNTCANVKLLESFRTDLFVNLRTLRREMEVFKSKLTEINEKIDHVDSKMDEKEGEEVQALLQRQREIDEKLSRLHTDDGSINNEINSIRPAIDQLERDIAAVKVVEGRALIAQKRMQICQKACEAIERIYGVVADKVKADCQDRISEIYTRFLKKPYKAELQDSYELRILKAVGDTYRPAPLSQGERQVTSLAFIGALVDIARKNHEEQKKFYFGGIYPVVMDSPFGQLDPGHRKNIAEGIPALAPQVVLMVAKQQWTEEVAKALEPMVGAQYHLKNYNPKINPDLKFEYTEVVEGTHGY